MHDIQTIVAGLRHRGIGVLITDHNVEQTLDIVDRAYIMFEGKVQAAGTVRELVYDDRVAAAVSGTHPDGAPPRAAEARGMRTGLSQHTSMRQELRVNPRLYQAMDMLYMPMMDLQQHLKQELLANPFLELLEPEDEESAGAGKPTQEKEKEQKEKEDEMDWEEILLNGFDVGGTREQFEQQEYTEPVTVETRNLIDHLREQLQMMELTPRQRLLAEEFLGNINEDGYLAASLEEILGSVNQLRRGPLSTRPRRRAGKTTWSELVEEAAAAHGRSRRRRALVHAWPKPRRCWRSSRSSTRRASGPATSASAS